MLRNLGAPIHLLRTTFACHFPEIVVNDHAPVPERPGFPDNAWSYRKQMQVFADAGYRAVSPFLRGYAPTEIPANGIFHSLMVWPLQFNRRVAKPSRSHRLLASAAN